jgi:hypothetical protein
MNIDNDQTIVQNDEPEEKSLRDELNEAVEQAESRARDEQGRFAQAEKDAASKAVAGKVATEQGSPVQAGTDATQAVPGAQAPTTDAPYPNSWKAEHRAKWDQLPPDLRQYITERETQIHKGMTAADEDRTFGKSMKDVVSPYMAEIRAQGGEPMGVMRDLLNTAYVLNKGEPGQKVELFTNLMQQYRISPQDLFNRLQGGQPQVDPQVSQLQARLDQIERERQADVQYRKQAEEQEALGTIEAFASQPGHEHYERVRRDMGLMLQNGQAASLQDAYDRAVWADPELRSTMITATTQTDQAKREAEAAARTAAARRAGSSVSGSPGAASPAAAQNNRSLREELEAAYQASSSG